jgi:AcrR family transcriptional regulator
MTSVQVRPYHHGDLRVALIARAEETLERTGVAGLSLRELAREVGVSHGAPRRHFADKGALLAALAEDGFGRLGAALAAAGEVGGTFDDRLLATAHAYVDFATAHPALLELMFTAKHGPAATPALVEVSGAMFDSLLALLIEGQRTGEVAPGDPERVGAAVFAAVHGIAALANAGMLDSADVAATVDDAVRRLMLGLQPR